MRQTGFADTAHKVLTCYHKTMEFYPWQKACINAWKNNGCRGIVNATTGAGKTSTALGCVQEFLTQYGMDCRIRIVVPTRNLAVQWKKAILSFFDGRIRRTDVQQYTSSNQRKEQLFSIYVINTARTCISGHIIKDMQNLHHVFLIVDECHRAVGECNRMIFSFQSASGYNAELFSCIGLSATVDSASLNEVLIPALGPVIYEYQAEQAQQDQVINPFVIISTSVNFTGSEMVHYGRLTTMISSALIRLLKEHPELKTLSDDYFFRTVNSIAREDETSSAAQWIRFVRERRSLLYHAENRQALISELIRRNKGRRILVFTERIDQCDEIFHHLQKEYPNKVAHFHSRMDPKARKNNLELFALGEQPILITCKALDEGMDVPDASIGIVVSTSSVMRQHVQRLGRILRKSDNKGLSILYYIYVADTVESKEFLPDISDDTLFINQKYLGKKSGFQAVQYENAVCKAAKLLRDNDPVSLPRFEECAQHGEGSGNWLMDDTFYQNEIARSLNKADKEYWISMKLIHDASEEKQDG